MSKTKRFTCSHIFGPRGNNRYLKHVDCQERVMSASLLLKMLLHSRRLWGKGANIYLFKEDEGNKRINDLITDYNDFTWVATGRRPKSIRLSARNHSRRGYHISPIIFEQDNHIVTLYTHIPHAHVCCCI